MSFREVGYTLSTFLRRLFKICGLHSKICRAAEFRPPCSKSPSAARQKLLRRAADFREQAALFYRRGIADIFASKKNRCVSINSRRSEAS